MIAIYTLLPKFSLELLQRHFVDIGKHTFSELDSYMYMKLTNNVQRFHSPSKMGNDCTFPYGGAGALQQKNVRIKIQYSEKMSQRFDTLKKEDPILLQDLIECFTKNLDQVMKNLAINDPQVLVNMIPDD